MGCVSILQFLLIGIVGGISFAATAPFGIGGDLVNMLQNADVQTGENAQIVEAFNGSFGSMTPLSFVLFSFSDSCSPRLLRRWSEPP